LPFEEVDMGRSAELAQQIETTLRDRVPEVEVLLAEQPSPGLVRVTIDRPGGAVDLDLCERVTRELSAVRERYALEVSSSSPSTTGARLATACRCGQSSPSTGGGSSLAR
jgi:hypothetical protein